MKLFTLAALVLCQTARAVAPAAPPVPVAPSVSSALYAASLRTLSIVRSGTAIDDPVTGIHRPASHLADAVLAGTSVRRDLTGGWYNAGDYGKWSMLAAITVSDLLDLYALQQRAGMPDTALLDEARWGLDWILKMQDPDGGVRQKVDGVTQASLSAAWGKSPELDPNPRIAAPASTHSTANAAAVLYQASQFFARSDHDRSRRYRMAADRAWIWLQAHPGTPANDPFYIEHDFSGELLWAQAEHALTCPECAPALLSRIGAADRRQEVHEVSWMDPSLLGLYDLASSSTAAPALRVAARSALVSKANSLAEAAVQRPFRVALGDGDYWWGSAERVLHRAALFLMADALQPSASLRRAAGDQLAWLLGNNAVQHSFVTGFGTHPVEHPWHWTYRDYGVVMPGWAVFGPNAVPDGADPALRALQQQGTPAARCYLDLCTRDGSWASNEGEITEQAALIFVTGVLRLPHERSSSR